MKIATSGKTPEYEGTSESEGVAPANFARKSEPLLNRDCSFVHEKRDSDLLSTFAAPSEALFWH